jgi:hypothetical protein
MADTWSRYFGGVQLTPGQIRDEQERRATVDQAMRGLNAPPEREMAFLQANNMLAPVPTHRPGEVWGDMGKAAYSTADVALKALDTLGRGRDAAIRAAQEVSGPLVRMVEGHKGQEGIVPRDSQHGIVPREDRWDPSAALQHLASIPINMAAPLTGERVVGGYGEPDDWRQYATPGNAMFLDMATDPGNWLPLPSVGAAKNAVKAAGPAMKAMRYGGGIPTSLIDSNGQIIRQLMSTPR